eukprot:SAG31_NODE_11195_length_1055_cov_3.579498_1_plen_101_part_00
MLPPGLRPPAERCPPAFCIRFGAAAMVNRASAPVGAQPAPIGGAGGHEAAGAQLCAELEKPREHQPRPELGLAAANLLPGPGSRVYSCTADLAGTLGAIC